ncbi:thiamine pyrophosphate-dependent enzyme, partial [Vibrio parahaemolyticus]
MLWYVVVTLLGFRLRRWATSGGLGSMGFGLPSALGAAVAFDGTDGGRPKKV